MQAYGWKLSQHTKGKQLSELAGHSGELDEWLLEKSEAEFKEIKLCFDLSHGSNMIGST